jgi:cysteine dioxygenase
MSLRQINDLVEQLCDIPDKAFSRAKVLEEIGRCELNPDSLEPYLFWSDVHYTRNLIHRCDLFEIVAIAWAQGQAAPIHNHRGQECWMGVSEGRLEVRNFKLVECDEAKKTCSLSPSAKYLMDTSNPAAVDPEEPIHSVHNLTEFGTRAVSVHVYSKPIDWCEVYYPDEGRYLEMKLCYTSKQGVLCPGEMVNPAVC